MKKIILGLSALFLTACSSNSEPVDSTPQKFGKAAPVLIEEFADLQCPGCALVSPQVKQIVQDNPDLARLEFYHFPLSVHQYAFVAAEAAECAADQGKFWEFVDKTYATQSSLNEDYLYKLADSLSLDRKAFDQCLDQRTYKKKIQAQMQEGYKRDIPGTPTLFVNGQLVKWTNAEDFEKYLKSVQ